MGGSSSELSEEQSSFSNLSIASPTSQLILQPFHRFTYVTAHSPTLPLLHLCHSSFSNPSFASPTSQALHLIHLVSHPCHKVVRKDEWLPTALLIMHMLSTSCKLSAPAMHQLFAHDVSPIELAQLMINFDWCYALCIQKLYHRTHFTAGRGWNKSLHLQPLQWCYCENSGNCANACVMWHHHSITYMQSLHTINGLLTVGRVGNLLCGHNWYVSNETNFLQFLCTHYHSSAQGQVFHCKFRHLGCSSVQRQVLHHKLRNQGCSFTRDEYVWYLPTAIHPHSLFSIWTDLTRSEKIPGAPACRWEEWIWLTEPSRLHWNSP